MAIPGTAVFVYDKRPHKGQCSRNGYSLMENRALPNATSGRWLRAFRRGAGRRGQMSTMRKADRRSGRPGVQHGTRSWPQLTAGHNPKPGSVTNRITSPREEPQLTCPIAAFEWPSSSSADHRGRSMGADRSVEVHLSGRTPATTYRLQRRWLALRQDEGTWAPVGERGGVMPVAGRVEPL